jgi:sugar lactone lactonase YvrE
MPTPRRINTFSAGELSKRMLGRPDLPVYHKGLKTCENFLPFPQGGLQTRPGTKYIGEVNDSSARSRLILFKFGTSVAYILEFGDSYFRAFKNNAGTYEEVLNLFDDMAKTVYDNKSSVTGLAGVVGLHLSSDGTKVYISDVTSSTVRQGNLSTAWNISTNTWEAAGEALDVSSEDASNAGIDFGDSGTKMYLAGDLNNKIFQYTLGTAWDISTGTYASKSLDISAKETNVTDVAISADGTKLYVIGDASGTRNIHQYALGTAWDVSTGVFSQSFNAVELNNSLTSGITFNSDGTRMYIATDSNDSIYSYVLGTAWDITTASYDSIFAVGEGALKSVAFDSNGTRMYIVGTSANTVFQYRATNGTPPYATADLLDIQYAQSNDTSYLAHPSHAPRKIQRASEDVWEISELNFIPPPTQEIWETSSASLTLSAATGNNIVITTSTATFLSAADTGKIIQAGTGRLQITQYISTTQCIADVIDNFDAGFYAAGAWKIKGSPNTQLNPSAATPEGATITLTATAAAFRFGNDSLPSDIGKYVYINSGVAQILNLQDITTAAYASKSADVSGELSNPQDIAFSSDGTKLYVIGSTTQAVFQYTLSTAWDVSTATYASKTVDVSSEEATPFGIAFKPDGTIMYIVGGTNDRVYQYTLSTAWDVSTATYASKNVSVNSEEAQPRGLFFKPDGLSMYVVGDASQGVFQYTLSTAWDVSTATYASKSKVVTAQDTSPQAAVFSADGIRMYVLGLTNKSVFQYTLTTPWDVSTATYATKTISVNAQDTGPTGLFFSSDVTKMYVGGLTNDAVFQYSMGSSTVVSAKIIRNLSAADATYAWTLEGPIWNATDGYPSTVVFHQDRLIWGGSTGYPQTIAASVTGDYENHERGSNDADAFLITLNAREVNSIEWLMSRQDLIVGTTEAEWAIQASGGILTPTDLSARLQTGYGSKSLRPAVIDGSILFFQRLGRKLRELTYDFNVAGYTAPDISMVAEHITDGGIEEVGYQQSPLSVLWMVRSDGQIVGLSFDKGTQTMSWHRHILGGAFSSGDAIVESVASIPHPTDDYDELFMIVKRTINGSTVRYIEVLTKIEDSTDPTDYWQVDSGKLFSTGAATSTITGMEHLEGQTVTVIDTDTGTSLGQAFTVSSGEVDISPDTVTDALVGLSFTPKMQPPKLILDYKHTTTEVFMEFLNSIGGQIGQDISALDDIDYPNDASAAPTLFTGTSKSNVRAGMDRDGTFFIVQNLPYPMTILSLTPLVEGGNA